MNDGGNGGPPCSMGTPGRDHWGNAMFCLMGGGGVKGGQIVGSTNRLGEAPKDRPLDAVRHPRHDLPRARHRPLDQLPQPRRPTRPGDRPRASDYGVAVGSMDSLAV